MDLNKKRVFSDEDHKSQAKRTYCPSLSTGFEAAPVNRDQLFSPELWSKIEVYLRRMVEEEVKSNIQSHSRLLLLSQLGGDVYIPNMNPLSLVNRKSEMNEMGEAAVDGSGMMKFKLCFVNEIASTIFTDSEIKAENGEELQVAICDATDVNAIVWTGPLSLAQVEFVVLDGEFGSSQRHCFNKSVLSARDGRRPLMVGKDLKIYLKNGIGTIKSLSITDNSSWMKSKKFRLGARIIDEKILAEFSRIGEALSQPFRVMDHRGEVNKKHHPPKGEDPVWRLEGIGKDGVYHNRLSSQGIETVDDFLKIHNQRGPLYLRKLLGKKVPNKAWKAMVDNALECFLVANSTPSFQQQNLLGNGAMGGKAFKGNSEVNKEMNSSDGNKFLEKFVDFDEELESMIYFEDPPLFSCGEASTSYNYNYEVGTAETHSQYGALE